MSSSIATPWSEKTPGSPCAVVADDVREVLDEVAAARDVEELDPRQIASTGMSRSSAAVQQRQLAVVAIAMDLARLRVRLLGVTPGRCRSRR